MKESDWIKIVKRCLQELNRLWRDFILWKRPIDQNLSASISVIETMANEMTIIIVGILYNQQVPQYRRRIKRAEKSRNFYASIHILCKIAY